MDYSNLCTQYKYSRGEAAQSAGVQGLLALLCILNASLECTEFTWALHNAIEYQNTSINPKDPHSVTGKSVCRRERPKSSADVMSHASATARVTVSAFNGLPEATEEVSSKGEGESSPSMNAVDKIAAIQILISDMNERNSKAEKNLEEVSEVLEAAADNTVPEGSKDKLKDARIAIAVN